MTAESRFAMPEQVRLKEHLLLALRHLRLAEAELDIVRSLSSSTLEDAEEYLAWIFHALTGVQNLMTKHVQKEGV